MHARALFYQEIPLFSSLLFSSLLFSSHFLSFSPSLPSGHRCRSRAGTYGPSGAGPTTTTATTIEYTYTEGGWEGTLHKVLLTGLKPSTAYTYQCGGTATADKSFTFVSAPAAGALPVVLGVVADLGENCDGDGCGNATIAALAAAAKAGSIGAILHAGDIAYTSGDQSIWDQYMREMEPAAGTVPYQVCVGNHESHYNFTAYLNRFAMSQGSSGGGGGGSSGGGGNNNNNNNNKNSRGGGGGGDVHAHTRITAAAAASSSVRGDASGAAASSAARAAAAAMPLINNLWHTFTYGAVRVVALSTEHDHAFGSVQYNWLAEVLAAASTPEARRQTPWIVVMAHRPMYCSTSDYYDCQINGPQKIAPSLEPLFHQHGVDLFVGGRSKEGNLPTEILLEDTDGLRRPP